MMIMATISALKPFSLLFILLSFASLSETSDITRLTGGRSSLEGRLEVQYGGKWGTVCSDYFTDKAAHVVCKELGYNGSLAFPFFGSFFSNHTLNTTLPIWLDDVTCTGTEEWIGFCTHRFWGDHDCTHERDVGVSCLPPPTSLPVRLAGGVHEYEGKLEVQVINGNWVPVCSSGWDKAAAQVICNQLGFDSTHAMGFDASILMNSSSAQQPSLTLYNLYCQGNESNIFQCQRDSFEFRNCDYYTKMAGVVCTSPPSVLPVRLVGRNNKTQGRVEIQLVSGEWGTICASYWDDNDAQVVCNQLGLNGTTGHAFPAIYFTNNTDVPDRPAILSSVDCVGNENWIGACSHADFNTNSWCTFNEDKAGVVCGDDVSLLSVRLVGGKNKTEGRVEIKLGSGEWGTICASTWDDSDAQVVCNQLGLNGTTGRAFSAVYFTNNTDIPDLPVILTTVDCVGNESWIGGCSHGIFSTYNTWCSFNDDKAGVVCSVDAGTPFVRLVGGRNNMEGRVEIQLPSGQWGTVCDNGFDDIAAQVLCSQLGFPSYNSRAITGAWFTNGTGNPDLPIVLDDVYCYGDESSILKCRHNTWGSYNCDHTRDVGVLCGPAEFHISATNNEVVSLPLYKAATCWLEKGCPHYAVPVNLTHAVLIAINTTCGNPISVVGTYSKPDSGHAVGLTAVVVSSETPGDRLRIPLPTVLGETFYVTVSTTSSHRDCKTTLLPHLRGDSFDVVG